MARRIYLHIGVMKSATSYLQGLCELNRERLATAGIFWCPDELRYRAVRDILGKSRAAPDGEKDWAHLVEAMRRHPGGVLLSNELLAGLGGHQVRRLVQALPDAEVRVIITARDLARIIPSHWQTTIKNGKTWSWAEFASSVCADGAGQDEALPTDERIGDGHRTDAGVTNAWFWRRHDLPVIIARWAQVLPLERITLVTVPADSGDVNTVAARFGSAVGVDASGFEQPDTRRNPSLGAHSVELLRRLNVPRAETELDDPDHRFERALGRALAVHADLEPRFALSPSQLDWVRRRATTTVDVIAQLGVQVVGDLADLVPVAGATTGAVDPGDTTDADLLAAASRGLVGLAPEFNELRIERNELRRQVSSPEAEPPRSIVDRLRSRLVRRKE